MEKIVQMLDSNDAEIVILGCILFVPVDTRARVPHCQSIGVGF